LTKDTLDRLILERTISRIILILISACSYCLILLTGLGYSTQIYSVFVSAISYFVLHYNDGSDTTTEIAKAEVALHQYLAIEAVCSNHPERRIDLYRVVAHATSARHQTWWVEYARRVERAITPANSVAGGESDTSESNRVGIESESAEHHTT
jgi:hypothetical protein